MRITAIEPQAHNSERFNLYVDGRFLLGVNSAIVLQLGLHVEQELLPEQLEQLQSDELEQQAVDRALNYRSFRPRSREEVRRYLRRKETPPDIIEAVLARLDRLDFVNDRAFASFWIETREQFNPRGAHALKKRTRNVPCVLAAKKPYRSLIYPAWITPLFATGLARSYKGVGLATPSLRTRYAIYGKS